MQMTQTHTRARAAKRRQGGFIITVELLLIATILVIGSIVGVIAIRDALVKRIAQQRSQAVLVIDDSGRVLGEALGFDEHEAPLVSYIDRTVPPAAPDPDHRNYRALIGVRDDRFTTREPVYYSGENCTGTPCMKLASDEDTDSIGYDGIAGTGVRLFAGRLGLGGLGPLQEVLGDLGQRGLRRSQAGPPIMVANPRTCGCPALGHRQASGHCRSACAERTTRPAGSLTS